MENKRLITLWGRKIPPGPIVIVINIIINIITVFMQILFNIETWTSSESAPDSNSKIKPNPLEKPVGTRKGRFYAQTGCINYHTNRLLKSLPVNLHVSFSCRTWDWQERVGVAQIINLLLWPRMPLNVCTHTLTPLQRFNLLSPFLLLKVTVTRVNSSVIVTEQRRKSNIIEAEMSRSHLVRENK